MSEETRERYRMAHDPEYARLRSLGMPPGTFFAIRNAPSPFMAPRLTPFLYSAFGIPTGGQDLAGAPSWVFNGVRVQIWLQRVEPVDGEEYGEAFWSPQTGLVAAIGGLRPGSKQRDLLRAWDALKVCIAETERGHPRESAILATEAELLKAVREAREWCAQQERPFTQANAAEYILFQKDPERLDRVREDPERELRRLAKRYGYEKWADLKRAAI